MFRIPRDTPWPPALDLTTVRETIVYMRDDARRVPGLEGVAAALDASIAEIDKAGRSGRAPAGYSPFMSRFLPRRH